MRGKNRILSFPQLILMALLLSLVFLAGAYVRDLRDSSDPGRVAREFFARVKAGDRDGALSLWSIPRTRRKTFGDLDVEITEGFLREGRQIRSVDIERIDFLQGLDALRPTDKSHAEVAEVTGHYVADGKKRAFQLSLRNAVSGVPLLNRLGPIWKVYLAAAE